MRLKLIHTKALPIGVDLGTSELKLAQMRQVDQGIELQAAGAAQAPENCRKDLKARLVWLGKSIRAILKANDFKGRRAVISLPAEATFVQHLRLPPGTDAETRKIVQNELHGKAPFSAGDAVIRHVVVGEAPGEGESRQEVIAVAADRGVLEAYLDATLGAGLDVIGVNIEACAIVECFARLFRRAADAARTTLFLDMGAASTQVSLANGNRLAFARNLAVGGETLDRAVSVGLRIPVDQARQMRQQLQKGNVDGPASDELYHLLDGPLDSLADEIKQCLRYHESVFRNQALERAIFLGGQANDKRLCQAIARRLNVPAQVGDPLARVRRVEGAGLAIGLDRREPQPAWAVAVGLSLGDAA